MMDLVQPQDNPAEAAMTADGSTDKPKDRKREAKQADKLKQMADRILHEKDVSDQIAKLKRENAELQAKLAPHGQLQDKLHAVEEKLKTFTKHVDAERQEQRAKERQKDKDIAYYRDKTKRMLEPINYPYRHASSEDFSVIRESCISRSKRSEIRDIAKRRLRICTSASHLAGMIRTDLNAHFRGNWQVFVGRASESYFVYQDNFEQSFVNFRYKELIDIRIQCIYF